MDDARLDEIRALATDWRTPLLSTSLHGALRDLLEAHDGLRARVMGLATELERVRCLDTDRGSVIARLRRLL